MSEDTVRLELEHAISDRRLLTHPFYRRWEAGKLTRPELAAYASQYRHFEKALPELLGELLASTDDPVASEMLGRNLADEEGAGQSHLELFDRFAASVGGRSDAPATAATACLVGTYRELVSAGTLEGVAALAAYESQAPSVAAAKADALVDHYGLDAGSARFWRLHADLDRDHSAWVVSALAALDDGSDQLSAAAARAAEAWWAFLDERDRELGVAA